MKEGFISLYRCNLCERKIGLWFEWDGVECNAESHKESSSLCADCLKRLFEIEVGITESKWF